MSVKFYVNRSPNGRTWEVLDSDGYSVSYVSYPTKAEALDAARVRAADAGREHESQMVAAHKAGIAYWNMNRTDAGTPALEFHARTCGWHGELCEAWLAGFYGAKRRDTVQS